MAKNTNSTGNSSLSANLLPNFYQTPANKKFLQATIDQLFQPGAVTKSSGFIGRSSSRAASADDLYIKAADSVRQNYQLEPGLTIKDKFGNVEFFKDYADYINQVNVFGGNTKNHSRLNEQEFYSWDPHIDWDKFVNFQNYYWLSYGPEIITVVGQQLAIESTYTVTLRGTGGVNQYLFSPNGYTLNPAIKLYRGQTYTFEINSPGNPFSIKTDRVIGENDRFTHGVDNFAVEVGTITFTVPTTGEMPHVLYYQSETDITLGGLIEIYSINEATYLDVENDIIGKKHYVLPDGTALSNGMQIDFIGNVAPAKYATGQYYVEGVGQAIKLVAASTLEIVSPYTVSEDVYFDNLPFDASPFDSATGYASEVDYITINRAARDHNPWSRYNRWVHQDVIMASAAFNGNIASLDQTARAIRPIIEFKPDLKLINSGTVATADVDLIDTFTSDIFSTIEGSVGYTIDGVDLVHGYKVLVTADTDPLVVNKIYEVQFTTINGRSQIHLAEFATPSTDDVTLILRGKKNQSLMYWYNGSAWVNGQQKTNTNQPPLFDVVDENGVSYSDLSTYNGSTFKGTTIFEYAVGTGTNDTALGFPLTYQNVSNIGDIVFNFTLATDTFQYKDVSAVITKGIDIGYLVTHDTAGNVVYENGWQTCAATTVQAAVRVYKGSEKTNGFDLDIYNDTADLDDLVVRVYKNGVRVNHTNWTLDTTNVYKQVNWAVDDSGNSLVTVAATDIITIRAFAKQPINSNGYYEIPVNLQNNPLNDVMTAFTLGEVSDHVDSILDNTLAFTGTFPGKGNLRDLGNITPLGTKFVQHSGPLSLGMYHITSQPNNIVASIERSRDDYNTFKRTFIAVSETLGVDAAPDVMVELVMQKVNANKPKTAPYYFSDMVPYGAKISTNLTVVDARTKLYPLSNTFVLDGLSNKAVGIYHNGEQLVYGRDYNFNTQGFVEIISDLTDGDTITTVEYDTTDGSYVPATPTKLGLWPKFVPMLYKDTSLITPRWMIQGHDGSQVLAYGDYDQDGLPDYRDALILELEKRIFNNIKVQYDTDIFDIADIIPGYNRTNAYSLAEFNQVLAPTFYKWTSLTGVDFTKQLSYDRNNSFTYDYSTSFTPDGVPVPSYWRGVYRWLLDTDRPNLCPWEMLGFSIEPSWWTESYGPAPYTSDNLVMWNDLADGLVREPNKPVIRLDNYVRPILRSHIPVDANGNLVSPVDAAIISGVPKLNIDNSFVFGDVSPVEAAWRRSSHYPFNIMITSMLLTPAKTFGLALDRSRIARNKAGQLVYTDTMLRIRPSDIVMPSIQSSTTRVQTAGIVNYIVDHILNFIFSNNVEAYNKYITDLKNLTPQLSYRVGAFTNKSQFSLLLESKTPESSGNVFVPAEDYAVFLNKSSPLQKLTYSGVIVTKLSSGFEIKGYSTSAPYFKYYNYLRNGTVINVGGISAAFTKWTEGKQYIVGAIVENNGNYYSVKSTHVAKEFTAEFYSKLPALPITGGVNVQLRAAWDREDALTIPYGTVFKTQQEVVDFMIGYSEWLKDQGFIFDDFDPALNAINNWDTSAREFLFWTTQNWSTGEDKWEDWVPNQLVTYGSIVKYNGDYYSALFNIPPTDTFEEINYNKLDGLSNIGSSVISLSPAAKKITFKTELRVVDAISDPYNPYEIFKVDGTPIEPAVIQSFRDGNVVTYMPTSEDGIFGASFFLIQNEHVLTINNKTIFNDTIYSPTSGYRQGRIKASGYITTNWYGGLDIPGFVYDQAKIESWKAWQDYATGSVVVHQNYYYSANEFVPGSVSFESSHWTKLDNKPEAQVLPNWTNLATQFTEFYSLESDSLNPDHQSVAQHLIGYQKRQYLENIIQDNVSEFKFFQGMIREKGTQNVLSKLFNALGADGTDTLTFYEEWALRVGQYGATDAFENIEVVLDEGKFRNNPQAFALVNNVDPTLSSFVIQQTPNDVYLKPLGYDSNPFPMKDSTNSYLRSPGFVNPNDVLLNIGTLSDILTQDILQFVDGSYVWCSFSNPSAENPDEFWNIYRYTTLSAVVETAIYDGSNLVVTTDVDTGLAVDQYIGLTGNAAVNGFYQVASVDGNIFTITASTLTGFPLSSEEQALIKVGVFVSQRISSIDALTPTITDNVASSDLIWTGTDKSWKVWEYNSVYKGTQLTRTGVPYAGMVGMSASGNVAVVSDTSGQLVTRIKTGTSVQWGQKQVLARPFIAKDVIGNNPNYNVAEDADPYVNNMVPSSIALSRDGAWMVSTTPLANAASTMFAGTFSPSADYVAGSIVKSAGLFYETPTAINHSYTGVTGQAFTSGQGAIFTVHFNALAVSVTVDAGGAGYHVGNKIKILGSRVGGTSPAFDITLTVLTVEGTAITSVSATGTRADNSLSLYTLVPGIVVPGTGATFTVHTTLTGYTLTLTSAGTGYYEGDKIVISGASVGGAGIDNDITVAINTVSAGTVTGFANTGKTAWKSAPYISVDESGIHDGYSGQGVITLYSKDINNTFSLVDTIASPNPAIDEHFGAYASFCDDTLFVSALGSGKVYTFKYVTNYISNPPSYNPVGSSGTTIKVSSTIGIEPGMRVTGTGFNNEIVVDIIDSETIQLNVAPLTTPSGVLNFAVTRWENSNEVYTNTIVTHFGRIVKPSADGSKLVVVSDTNVFVYDRSTSNPLFSESGYISAALSNTGEYLAVGTGTDIEVYKLSGTTYTLYQTFLPIAGRFGDVIEFMNDYETLIVYTADGDAGSTSAYDRYGDFWVLAENIVDTTSDYYLAVGDNQVMVTDTGVTLKSFVKSPGATSWELKYSQLDVPEITRIKRAFLYDKALGELVTYIDVIDPAQGKIPGIADEELKFKTFYDPATYSDSDTDIANVNKNTFWSKDQVGMLWWDLRTAKFVHSYFNDVVYRSSVWNTLAAGASIDIYEWVESKVKPAAWDAVADTPEGVAEGISGTSLYGNSSYSVRKNWDNISKTFKYTYYFWVKNKNVVPVKRNRRLSALNVANLISNPRGQGYSYLAITGTNSFSLVNTQQYLNDDNVVLSIEYWLTDKTTQNIHTQWKLVSNDPIVQIPKNIEAKWFDSLCGIDDGGRLVPDLLLPPKLRYGIENRPRQSMFVNRIEALKEFVERVNTVLKASQIVGNYNISALEQYEQAPSSITGLFDITLDTSDELRLTNASSFVQAVVTPVVSADGKITDVTVIKSGRGYLAAPSITIHGDGINAELKTIINTSGQVIGATIINGGEGYVQSTTSAVVRSYSALVKSDVAATGSWAIYTYDTTDSVWSRILTQSYDVRKFWKHIDWYASGYNQFSAPDYAVNTFNDLNAISPSIGEMVKVVTANSGGWLLLEKYANSTSVDWTQSYIVVGIQDGTIQLNSDLYDFAGTAVGYDASTYDGDVYDVGAIRELRIILNTLKDSILVGTLKQSYLELFLASLKYAHSEQVYLDWAFKTSFVRATHLVGELDQPVAYPIDNMANFEDFIAEVKPYRTHIREYISNYTKLDVSSMSVTDFDLQPIYTGGQDELINAYVNNGQLMVDNELVQTTYPWKHWNDNVGFSITDLVIVDGGSGYTEQPTVTIGGNGGAVAKAYIANGKVSRLVLITPGKGYLAAPSIEFDGGNGTGARAVAIIGDSLVRANLIAMRFDRITQSYYMARLEETDTIVVTANDNSRLQFPLTWAPDVNVGKASVLIDGVPILREKFKLAIVKSRSTGTTRYSGSITFKNPPGTDAVITINYIKDITLLNAADRIQFYYGSNTDELGKDLTQLMTGIDYGGVQVSGLGFDATGGWDIKPYGTENWDVFDAGFNDYIVSVAADTHEFTYPHDVTVPVNIYYIGQVVTEVPTEESTTKYFYNSANAPTAYIINSLTTNGVTAEGTTEINVDNTDNIKIGDVITVADTVSGTVEATSVVTTTVDDVVTNTYYVELSNVVGLYVGSKIKISGIQLGGLIGGIYYVASIVDSKVTLTQIKNGPTVLVFAATANPAYKPTFTAVNPFSFDTQVVSFTDTTITVNQITFAEIVDNATVTVTRTLKQPTDVTINANGTIIPVVPFPTGSILRVVCTADVVRLDADDWIEDSGYTYGGYSPSNANAVVATHVDGDTSTVFTLPSNFPIADNDTIILRQNTSDGSIVPQSNEYDTDISGGDMAYLSATGYNPEDIIIDGSGQSALGTTDGFVTPTSSPGPEELVPGQVVDAVAIKVFDHPSSGSASIKVDSYIADSVKSSFKMSQRPNSPRAVIVKLDNDILTYGDDYTIDYSASTINIVVTPNSGSTVSIFNIGFAGRNIIDLDYFVGDGTTTEFMSNAPWILNDADQLDVTSLVCVDGLTATGDYELFKTDATYDLPNVIGIRFLSTPPASGKLVNYIIVRGLSQTFAVTSSEIIETNGVDTTYPVNFPIGAALPNESNMIVRVGQTILSAPNNSYFTISNNRLTYAIDTNKFPPFSVAIDELNVFANGELLRYGYDYTADLSVISVKINKTVYNKYKTMQLVISVATGQSYTYNAVDQTVTFTQVYNDPVEVIGSYLHDVLDIQRTTINVPVSVSLTPDTVEFYLYHDILGGRIRLDRTILDDNYVWVVKNNKLLTPSIDYKLNPDRASIQLAAPASPNDSITLMTFGQNVLTTGIAYMQFKDMLNRFHFKRLNANKQSRIVRDLRFDDLVIHVEDASSFEAPNPLTNKPGVVDIRGERIEYFEIRGNTLRRLRRATLGTGAPLVHKASSVITDIGSTETLPYTESTTTETIVSSGNNLIDLTFVPAKTETTWAYDTGFESTIPAGYGQGDDIEVFAGGTRLKKKPYYLHSAALAPYSPEGDVQFDAEFTVDGETAQVRLTTPVPLGTQVTVIRRLGTEWDSVINIQEADSKIARFLRSQPGVWYTDVKQPTSTEAIPSFDSNIYTFDDSNTTFDSDTTI